MLKNIPYDPIKLILSGIIILLHSCHSGKKNTVLPDSHNSSALRVSLTKNDSLLGSSTDSLTLVQLNQSNILLSEKIPDWNIWCKSQLALYEIKSEGDENYAKGKEHLDAIIAKEPLLSSTDSLKPWLAKAFGYRYFIFEAQEINHKVIADCEKYLQYSTPELDKEYLNFILNASGIAYCKIGDHQESVNKLEQLLQRTDLQDNTDMGRTYVNLANSYYNLGNAAKAKEVAEKGLAKQELELTHRAFLYAIIANTAIGTQNFTLAENSINSALALLKNSEEKESLADLYSIQGDLNSALKNNRALLSYQSALAYRKKNNLAAKGREIAKLHIKIGGIALDANNTDEAINQNNKALEALFDNVKKEQLVALPDDKDLFHENSAMDALDANARALLLRAEKNNDIPDLTLALQCIHKAFAIETLLRQQYIYDNSKYASTAASKNRSATAIFICNKLYHLTKMQGWAEKALLFAEKSKANILTDKVRENILLNQNNQTVQHAKTLRILLEEVTMQLKTKEKTPQSNPETIAALKKDKVALENEFAIYQSLINTSLYEQSQKLSDKETMALLKKNLLHSNNSIVEYFIADSLLYIFKADKKSGVQMQSTDYTEIEKELITLLPYYTQPGKYNNNPKIYDSIALQLYRKLLAPFLSSATKQELLIIPDGKLYSLPFESLKNEQNQYLIYQVNIVYGFSCASLIEQAQIKTMAPENSMAVYAPFIQHSRNQLAILEESENEVNAIAAFHKKATVFTNTKATLQSFVANAGNNSVLHLATHAIANENDPAATRIEFADSSLFLNKVYGMNINNNLVVLSACETGVGILQQTEGNLSLARAFYYAGAKNVINSLWKADDKSTGMICSELYRQLNEKTNIANALYQSKLLYLKNAGIEKQAPYYWSSFICIGTGDTHIKGSTSNFWYWFAGALGLLLMVFLLLKRKQHQK